MAFRVAEGESVADGIRRIAREQIDGAIEKVSTATWRAREGPRGA